MKKQVLKFGFRKALMVAGFIGTLSLSSVAATKKDGGTAAETVVQYVGTSNAGVVFNVKYDNLDAAKFDLVIKNEFGDVIYQQQFSDKNFDKKVVLVKEPGDARLTFLIKSSSANYKQSFDISTTTRTVEDVVVKNVK